MTLAAGDPSKATAIFVVEFTLLQSKMPLGHSFFQKGTYASSCCSKEPILQQMQL
jgi:hypothetical protein